MKWQPSPINQKMTIIVVAHNLHSLFYPFVESFYSSLPLGCNYLIGNFDSTDHTMDLIKILCRYAPMEVVHLRWRPETGGTAIGLATQRLLSLCKTPLVLNLQANEVLCDDAITNTLQDPRPSSFRTRHFWGNLNFDGSIGGHGYGEAPRIYSQDQKGLDCGDGCWPPGGCHLSLWPIRGTLHRYSYCFDNQVAVKAQNHYKLYLGHAQTPQERLDSINWCKRNPNYFGPHPQCVQHLLGQINYDSKRSWDILGPTLEPL